MVYLVLELLIKLFEAHFYQRILISVGLYLKNSMMITEIICKILIGLRLIVDWEQWNDLEYLRISYTDSMVIEKNYLAEKLLARLYRRYSLVKK